jgi:signal transduction histidine kinase/CHASE2 domain-containing sensor protein
MASMPEPQPDRSRFGRWIVLNAILLGLVGLASLTYPVEELSRRAGDLYFRLRAPQPASDQVALVLIDDASLEQYGRWPWPRSLLAKLVREVSAHHPRALGVDILLPEPEDERDDRDLAAAFQGAGNVVLAAKIGSAPGGHAWVEPLPLFARSAAGIGHVQAELGPDGICRRVPVFEMTAQGPRPALALAVARWARGQRAAPALEGDRISPQFLIVNFRGQIGPASAPFRYVSAANLLQGTEGQQLEGRAVFIGFASTEIADRLPSPVGDQSPMPGVEIHANLADEILSGRELKPLPWVMGFLLLVSASLVLSGIILRRPGWTGLAASGGFAALGYAGGYALFDGYERLISFGPFFCLCVLATPLAQLQNLLDVDRGLTRSLRQLETVLCAASGRHPHGAEPGRSKVGLHWKLATLNRLEAELSSLYAFEETLLDSMQEGLAVFGPDGQLIFHNRSWNEFCQKLNWQAAASLPEFLATAGKPEWRERPEEPGARLETELLRDHGLWQIRAIRLPSTSHAGVGSIMVVISDLTARLERDRARAEALGFVTHELRTPLVSIQGFAEFLLRYPHGAGAEEAADTIFRESKRLVAMVNTYLDVMRMESGARPLRQEKVDVEATVAQVEKVMRPLAQAAQVEVSVMMDQNVPALLGDAQLLGGAFLNLVSNAVKYSPGRSAVQVRVAVEAEEVIFEVANSGPVIPPEHLAHLFDPFYRRPEQEWSIRGWGLGLAFVKRIAEAHGGRVEVASNAVAGTRFRIVLPCARAVTAEVAL